jgi:hypothetical protein
LAWGISAILLSFLVLTVVLTGEPAPQCAAGFVKIAVNAHGCNAAALLSFGRRMIAESPWNRYRFAASHHAVVTAGFLTGFANVGVTRRSELGVSTKDEVWSSFLCIAGRLSRWPSVR